MTKYFVLVAAAFLLTSFSISSATPPAPAMIHVRGTIKSVQGHTIVVSSTSGPITVKLVGPAKVLTVVSSNRSEIKPGSFLGITSITEPNGSQRAAEIHVFPANMKGTGEGSYPWDYPSPTGTHSKMTNGTVSLAAAPRSRMTNGTVSEQKGNTGITLTYKSTSGNGAQLISIPANIPIVTFAPGSPSDLKPGTRVFVIGSRNVDGTVSANRILAGKNGIDPPM